MLKYCAAVLFFLLLTPALQTTAQSLVAATDSVSAVFTKFEQTRADKNIVLLTDRNIYIAGEKIWFKAYVVSSMNGKPDLTVMNLFADIVNEKDSIIEQLVLDNANLRTDGAFKLPASLPTGFYWIRCYTASQLQGDHAAVFLRPVYIVNKQLHDQDLYAKQFENNLANNIKSDPVVHFFAERLTAIPGIISTGVIEIKDAFYNPLSVKGELVNSNDSIITVFKTNCFGLARLSFVDDPTEKYTAIFHFNGQSVRHQLPAVDSNSIQLSVANQTAKTIKAFVTLENAVPADMRTTILAVQRDSLYYAAVGTGSYGITIPIEDFPGGIVKLLVFDDHKTLVNERKIYIPNENVELKATTGKKKYAARENVNVHVKVTGSDGKPLASVLSVAVQNQWIGQFSDSMEANRLPPSGEFLLDDWLNRYHSKYDAADVDLLMATKKSILQPLSDSDLTKESQDYGDSKKLQMLTGKIVSRKGVGMSDRIVTALAKNAQEYFTDVDTTDKAGVFNLSIPQGFDSLQFSLQVTNKHKVLMPADSIQIDDFHYPVFSTPPALKQQFLAGNLNSLALIRRYHVDTAIIFQGEGWLAPVTVTTTQKQELNYDASRRITSISQILTSDKFRYGGADAISNALLTVPGVSLAYGDITIFGPRFGAYAQITKPLIIMDGYAVPLTGDESVLKFLNNLNPADIDFIEVLRGAEAASFGGRGSGGVISINTRHGYDGTSFSKNNFRMFTPATYHVCPKFEMPDYSNKAMKSRASPDIRTTIYWNGNIITDANGEANINFYTADNPASYVITITGLTEKGDLVYKRIIIGNSGKGRQSNQ